MTVKLFQFPPAWGLPNPSPFCMKVETFLRMAGIAYEIESWADPRKAPKGKLPLIEHKGKIIADSHFILAYLTKTFSLPLDEHLSLEQKAQGFFMGKMLDEYFYWFGVHNRWIDESVWPVVRETFFRSLKQPLRTIVAEVMRRKVRRNLQGQGIGHHEPEEIVRLVDETLSALSDYLGDKPYLMGDRPTSYDAILFSQFVNMAFVPFTSQLQEQVRARANLCAHAERMRETCFPELAPFSR